MYRDRNTLQRFLRPVWKPVKMTLRQLLMVQGMSRREMDYYSVSSILES